MFTETLSTDDGDAGDERTSPALVIAFECARPLAGAWRVSLRGCDEVRVGRGDERRVRRAGNVAFIEIPDGAMSAQHLRLVANDAGWMAIDQGSKNGTGVGGHRIDRQQLADGDVIDAAKTMLLYADGGGTRDPGDAELTTLGGGLDTLDPALGQRFVTAARIAAAPVSVIVLGESGTGKELVARAIHEGSRRRGAFVAVNCGALPATLVESELFGYRKGAFSGATDDRPGLVRAADRGTLFLDEIADLAAPSQAALLRVLQEREVTPLGASAPVAVDVRVVAATCQALPALVELGRFRRDLHARLAGYTIALPPLRRRKVDLGWLIGRRLRHHLAGREPPRFERAAARALFLHEWPDNVRELDQALAAALAIADDEIAISHLPDALRRAPEEPAPPAAATPVDRETPIDRDTLMALLTTHAGNVSRVAEALGTSRSQVRRLAARFAIDLAGLRS